MTANPVAFEISIARRTAAHHILEGSAHLNMETVNVPLNSTWLDVHGLNMHARVYKAGNHERPAVVLVHGFIVSSLYMIPVAEIQADEFDVYALDLPGFGRSDKSGRFDTIEDLAEWLVLYMDAAGLQKPTVIGNSMGCQVVVEAAVRHPEKFGSIILSGPVIERTARHIPVQVWRALRVYPREKPMLVRIHAIDYLRAGPRRFMHCLRSMMAYPIERRLPLIQDPVLVVRGQYDTIVTQGWAEECARLLTHGTLVVLAGAAHTTNYSHPQKLARVIRQYLARTGDAKPDARR